MKTKSSCGIWIVSLSLALIFFAGCTAQKTYQWEVHDMNRPRPEVVTPGENTSQPPSDAIILFDGTDLSQWESAKDSSDAKWLVKEGYMEVAKKAGNIQTKKKFGDYQLHIEWATPAKISGKSQGRGNSGIFLAGTYEVQVLDSYKNDSYPDGQAAGIYGQKPPLVNVCRPPGKWQSYDIIFHRPIFKNEKLVKPATVTVLQNGVLVQDNWTIEGITFHKKRAEYRPHADRMPLELQDHGNPIRYRNIWLREL